MTTLREAAQQALEALGSSLYPQPRQVAAIAALRAALAEPVQEPVAWLFTNLQSGDYDFCYQEDEHNHDREMWHKQPLYSAPPQRKPLTEEEILKAIGWERAEMYMKLTPNFPVAEAKKETLKNARAIERAHGIWGDK